MLNRPLSFAIALLCVCIAATAGSYAPLNMVLHWGVDTWSLVENGEKTDADVGLLTPEFPLNLTITTDSPDDVYFFFYNTTVSGTNPYYSVVQEPSQAAVPFSSFVSSTLPMTISVKMDCEETLYDQIIFSFMFLMGYEPVVITLPTMCFMPGCEDLCDMHGSCKTVTGYCVCEYPWQGSDCFSVFEAKKESFCPGESIQVEVALAKVRGKEWYSIYNSEKTSIVYDWNYLADATNTSDYVEGKPFPAAGDGSTFTLTIPAMIPPGDATITLYISTEESDENFLSETYFTVLNFTDPACGSEENTCVKTGCKNPGTCNEDTGICECDNSRNFWFDCSHGCKEETVMTANEGIIDSAGDDQPPLYTPDTKCTWIIHPEQSRFDYIHITFERFQVTNGDKVKIVTVGESGIVDDSSVKIEDFSGFTLPDERRYEDHALGIVLEADYASYGSGFRLRYEVVTEAPIAGIAIGVGLGVLVLAVIIGVLIWHRRSQKSTAVEKARHVRSVPLPSPKLETETQISTADDSFTPSASDSNTEGETTSSSGLNKSGSSKNVVVVHPPPQTPISEVSKKKSMKSFHVNSGNRQKVSHATDDNSLGWSNMEALDVKTHLLQFGLESQATFPVMQDMTENVQFTNNSSKPLQFRISHPVDENTFECYAEPGMGTLLPGYGVTVQFHFKLKYTTRVFSQFQVCVWKNSAGSTIAGFCGFDVPEGKEPDCTAYVATELEGEVSERLDPNELVLSSEPLGVGAFGVVYAGQYRQTLVAVKVMSRQHELLEQILSDFEKEIELYRKLRNPLLVEFIGASLVPGKLCICTELIKHGSLEQLINEVEVPFALQTKFALNIAEAVEYLHMNNVLYRDLKPSNVMIVSTAIGSKINCKIGDFGTARNVKDVRELFTYTTGQGTPIYMAPEILDVKAYNYKADVYSYAITLWQMYTGEKPWTNIPVWSVPSLVISGQRPDCPEKMPKEYADLIRKCWSAPIDERPDFHAVIELLLPIAKKAKKEFKSDPNAEQQLRKVQAVTAACPAALSSLEAGTNSAKIMKGVPTAAQQSTFTLGLTDVSATAGSVGGGKKTNLTSTASVTTEPQGAVVPEELVSDDDDDDDDDDDEDEDEDEDSGSSSDSDKKKKDKPAPKAEVEEEEVEVQKPNKHISKHSHSSHSSSRHSPSPSKHSKKQSKHSHASSSVGVDDDD